MCGAVTFMRTAINGTPNVFGMILWVPRGRVESPGAARAVGLGTREPSPGIEAREPDFRSVQPVCKA